MHSFSQFRVSGAASKFDVLWLTLISDGKCKGGQRTVKVCWGGEGGGWVFVTMAALSKCPQMAREVSGHVPSGI